MSLFKQIETDYITAYKAKDTVKVAVLRHLKTAIKNRMVEDKVDTLPDDVVLDLLAKQVKQRKDSFDQYTKAGRDDLAKVEAEEMAPTGAVPAEGPERRRTVRSHRQGHCGPGRFRHAGHGQNHGCGSRRIQGTG